MSDKPAVGIINLLIECIEKMKTIGSQDPAVQTLWVKVIREAVDTGRAYIQYQATEEALNDMGTVPATETKTFV